MDKIEDLKTQVSCALQEASFPITSEAQLYASLPCGLDTTFKVADKEVKVADAAKHLRIEQFPIVCAADVAGIMCDIWDENKYL